MIRLAVRKVASYQVEVTDDGGQGHSTVFIEKVEDLHFTLAGIRHRLETRPGETVEVAAEDGVPDALLDRLRQGLRAIEEAVKRERAEIG